jgi:hypothetical protein
MEQEDDRAVGAPFVEVVDPQRAAVLIGDLRVVGLEVESGKTLEAAVRGS